MRNDEDRFIRGLMFAIPVSVVLWLGIGLLVAWIVD